MSEFIFIEIVVQRPPVCIKLDHSEPSENFVELLNEFFKLVVNL